MATTKPEPSVLGRWALLYAERGVPVFPQWPDKRACIRGWPDAASTDADTVAGWWRDFPDANLACCVGRAGLVVVDIDRHGADGFATFADLERTLGPLPGTITSATGGGGEHRFFSATGAERFTILGPGVELLAGRRAVTLPPSVHKSGTPYRWTRREFLAGLPAAWAAAVTPAPVPPAASAPRVLGAADGYVRRAVVEEVGRVLNAPEGTRGNTLNRAAFSLGTLIGAGLLAADDVEGPLVQAATAAGVLDRAARDTVRRALRAGAAHPRSVTPRRVRV